MLRPETTADEVDNFATGLGWELVTEIERDREGGVDGQLIWQGQLDVALHFIVDATSGVPYVVLTGAEEEEVRPVEERFIAHLRPLTLDAVIRDFDAADDDRDRARGVVRMGLAAPEEFHAGAFLRICETYSETDPRVRYAGLWAATYTGYQQFVDVLREIAQNDPEEYVRSRAATIVTAFTSESEEA